MIRSEINFGIILQQPKLVNPFVQPSLRNPKDIRTLKGDGKILTAGGEYLSRMLTIPD
jgi:hypothetical protein